MTLPLIRPMLLPAALLAALLLLTAPPLGAVGMEDYPPEPTETTTTCPEGSVWDTEAEACIAIEDSALSDPARIEVARELAYFGRAGDALALLSRAQDQDDTMVQTYLGFAHRLTGDMARALHHYRRALVAHPDNALARSYLGMAYLQAGRPGDADAQLAQIRARGGTGTWPERALAEAIRTGILVGY